MKRKFQSFIIILSSLVVALILYNDARKIPRKSPESFATFNNAEIRGHLYFLNKNHTMESYFSISEDSNVYYKVAIYPIGSDLRDLGEKAAIGDYIIKHRHSDTLTLLKHDTINYFIINKKRYLN